MPARPVPVEPRPVSLASTSRAADAGFLTLADLAHITTSLDLDYRIVGGHMVTLLVALHGVSAQVPLRETADADFAALPTVIADPRLPAALVECGYRSREAANRFTRDTIRCPPTLRTGRGCRPWSGRWCRPGSRWAQGSSTKGRLRCAVRAAAPRTARWGTSARPPP